MTPQPIFSDDALTLPNQETLQLFVKEMQSINFYDFAGGDCHSSPRPYLPPDLYTCPKVWMRVDRVRRSLEAPYVGPYEVVRRAPKFFTLKLPHGTTSVSIDRLKPAHIALTTVSDADVLPMEGATAPPARAPIPLPSFPDVPSQTTRSGRVVRFRKVPEFIYF